MNTRNQILSAGMLREPHPQFGLLTYARWQKSMAVHEALRESGNVDLYELRAIQWVISTRPSSDPELVAAMAGNDKSAAFRPLWEDSLHASDITPFATWWNEEMEAYEAAATVHKPDTRLGKSEASEELTPTT
jgi:hypothetical protein